MKSSTEKIKHIIKAHPYQAILACLIVLIGALLRFYNLKWAIPFLHPDEFNIAYTVSIIRIFDTLDPKFFAYGGFPIYLLNILAVIQNIFTGSSDVLKVTAEQAIYLGRYLTAFSSLITIILSAILVHQITKSVKWTLVGLTLTAFSPGLIQYAHFGTFETYLLMAYLLVAICAIRIIDSNEKHSFWIMVFL